MMRNKRHIIYFLMITCMVMLVAPLIPHHHHSNGIICMKDDIKDTECPCDHQHHHHKDDPCCTSDCMTIIESSVPAQQLDEVQPQYFYIATLFTEPLLRFLTQPEERESYRDYAYLESLHGTYIICAAGLRAPPTFTI